MLYVLGTGKEIERIVTVLPERVLKKVENCISILDDSYGKARDYFSKGGYVIIGENCNDVLGIKHLIDFENYSYEWIDKVDDYVMAMYLINDDYAVVLTIPAGIAPNTFLNGKEGASYENN